MAYIYTSSVLFEAKREGTNICASIKRLVYYNLESFCLLFFVPFLSQVQIHSGTKAGATKFASSGVDGRLVIWNVKVTGQLLVTCHVMCIITLTDFLPFLLLEIAEDAQL